MPRHSTTLSSIDLPLDAVVRLHTPERIVFDYPLAGPFRRFVAYLLDLAIQACLVIAGPGGLAHAVARVFLGDGPGARGVLPAVLGLRGLLRGALQRPDARETGDRAPRGLGGGGADHRGPGGPPQPGGDGRRARAVLLPAGALEHAPDPEVPAAGRPGGGDDGRDRGAQAAARAWSGSTNRRSAPCSPWLPLRIAAGLELARALSDYVRRRHRFEPGPREEMAEPLARPAAGPGSACPPASRPTRCSAPSITASSWGNEGRACGSPTG